MRWLKSTTSRSACARWVGFGNAACGTTTVVGLQACEPSSHWPDAAILSLVTSTLNLPTSFAGLPRRAATAVCRFPALLR